ncbi:DgyrCDS5432 [Dimorphilus gyrociliatus]|uniref:DgyrCDS5432 n=1 Tax=Dimorphilus gyrociliatus TaxID=2664684 RepID=A0A7I8VLI2_9ANNE|nr:DgyrCDS5432 [Dimorphilus gyrociliatus]
MESFQIHRPGRALRVVSERETQLVKDIIQQIAMKVLKAAEHFTVPKILKMKREESRWKRKLKQKLCRINLDTLMITIGFYTFLFLVVNIILNIKQRNFIKDGEYSPKLFFHSRHEHNPMINHHPGMLFYNQTTLSTVHRKSTTAKLYIAEQGFFSKSSLKANDKKFELNGKYFRILAGQFDFTKVIESEWKDRLKKLKLAGLNTVVTTIIWNELELSQLIIDKEKISRFLQTVKSVGLKLIVDCGPYVGPHIVYGGLPSWMIKDGIKIRSIEDKKYLKAINSFLSQVAKILWRYQYLKGGPLIAIMIERDNNNVDYLKNIISQLRLNGLHEMIFSSKQVIGAYLTLFVPEHSRQFSVEKLITNWKETNKHSALFLSNLQIIETTFYGTKPKQINVVNIRKVLKYALANGASINIAPFIGGSRNFRVSCDNSKKTCSNKTVIATTFHYSLPVNSLGEESLTYFVMRDLFKEMSLTNDIDYTMNSRPDISSFGIVKLDRQINIQQLKEKNKKFFYLENHEKPLIPSYGEIYVTYTTFVGAATYISLKGSFNPGRVQIIINNHKLADVISLNSTFEIGRKILIPRYMLTSSKQHTLMLVVKTAATLKKENLVIKIQGKTPKWWRYIHLQDINTISLNSTTENSIYRPAFLCGSFFIKKSSKLAYSWLKLEGLGEGQVYINGFTIGSYMNINWPHSKMLVPMSYLKYGKNTITILELTNSRTLAVAFSN